MKKSLRWGGVGWVGWGRVVWGGLNPNLVSALAPFGLVRAGAEIGAELDNRFRPCVLHSCGHTTLC